MRGNTRAERNKKFARFLHNKEQGTYCNKKPIDWMRILLYIFLFNGAVFAMFVGGSLYVTNSLKINNKKAPYIDKAHFSDVSIPALSFVPIIAKWQSAVIGYEVNSKTDYGKKSTVTQFIEEIDKQLKPYREAADNLDSFSNCTDEHLGDNPCFFDLKTLGPCANNDYGYADRKPCVYFRLNKFTKWKPEPYATPEDVDEDIPNKVKEHLKARKNNETNNIYFQCDVSTGFSDQHYNISTYPKEGFPFQFFPYNHEADYLPPLVAIKFDRIDHGYGVVLECSIYCKNIPQSKRKEEKLELMIYVA